MNRRFKDEDWDLPVTKGGTIADWQSVHIAVAMDIRDELKRLNALLHCQNFIAIPRKLDAIARKIPARKKRKRAQ